MPIYEYRCDKCEREFEVEQRITDPPLGACPKCRSRKVRRLISQTSFVLKGGGWYSDLYSSKSSSPASKEKEGGGDAKESKDAKPAAEAKETGSSKGSEGSGGSGKKGKKSESKSAA